jgi:uncharacterized membrane protein YedE/YeeE
MDFGYLIDRLGDAGTGALLGLLIGLSYGFFAQRCKFCLRAATVEVGRGEYGSRLAIWLIVFAFAIVGTHAAIAFDALGTSNIRVLNARGSLSGAIIGGAVFGAGMVLARGCPSRLLVLSGQGNLRSVISGLIFAVTAQASLGGVLAPARTALSSLWMIDGAQLNAANLMGLSTKATLVAALIWLAAAVYFALKSRLSAWGWIGAVGVGLTIMVGWLLTYSLSLQAFDPQPLKSVTFSGPSARALMALLAQSSGALDFDIGLVPGVFLGALFGGWIGGELKLEGFQSGHAMRRYIVGAVLMGFGAMLAGGCAVGSVSNASVLATIAWVALFSMWAGAVLTDAVVDWPGERGTTLWAALGGHGGARKPG